MVAFEIVIIAVVVVSVAMSLTRFFHPNYALSQLGRQGKMWFEYDEERAVADRPTEDDVDSPLPHRPLRGRY